MNSITPWAEEDCAQLRYQLEQKQMQEHRQDLEVDMVRGADEKTCKSCGFISCANGMNTCDRGNLARLERCIGKKKLIGGHQVQVRRQGEREDGTDWYEMFLKVGNKELVEEIEAGSFTSQPIRSALNSLKSKLRLLQRSGLKLPNGWHKITKPTPMPDNYPAAMVGSGHILVVDGRVRGYIFEGSDMQKAEAGYRMNGIGHDDLPVNVSNAQLKLAIEYNLGLWSFDRADRGYRHKFTDDSLSFAVDVRQNDCIVNLYNHGMVGLIKPSMFDDGRCSYFIFNGEGETVGELHTQESNGKGGQLPSTAIEVVMELIREKREAGLLL